MTTHQFAILLHDAFARYFFERPDGKEGSLLEIMDLVEMYDENKKRPKANNQPKINKNDNNKTAGGAATKHLRGQVPRP